MTVLIHVEVRLPTPNALMREFYMSRSWRRKKERRLVREALERARAQGAPFPKLPIICTLIRYSANHCDSDGLSYSAKSARDEISLFYGVDDADHLGNITWRYEAGRLVREKVMVRAKGGKLRPAYRAFLRIRLEPTVERARGGLTAACADGLRGWCERGWSAPDTGRAPEPRRRRPRKAPAPGKDVEARPDVKRAS